MSVILCLLKANPLISETANKWGRLFHIRVMLYNESLAFCNISAFPSVIISQHVAHTFGVLGLRIRLVYLRVGSSLQQVCRLCTRVAGAKPILDAIASTNSSTSRVNDEAVGAFIVLVPLSIHQHRLSDVKTVDFQCPQVAWQLQTPICYPAVKQGLILE
jgi:hypothetical protein